MKKSFIIAITVSVLSGVILLVGEFFIKKEITGWFNRAQVAADAKQLHKNMVKVKNGMERHGMINGYAAYIFWRTPDYNMAEIFKAVNAIVSRAEKIAAMDQTSTTYQVALDDLRGTIRELDLHAWEYKWRHSGYLLFMVLCIIGVISAVVFLYLWIYEVPSRRYSCSF